LSRDHLDYHATMESYFQAKQRLFDELLPKGAAAVLNADVPEFDALAAIGKKRGHKIVSYGMKGKEIKLIDLDIDAEGQIFRAELFGKKHDIALPVIGKFQTWNALCALGLVTGCGANTESAVAVLGKISGVPGRLELAGRTGNGASVFVDYAHKPDALENVLSALRAHVETKKGARLGVVFGCGGNRDKGKRPMMGAIARKLADWVIVTDDNPRHEDPAAIRKEILNGAAVGEGLQEIGDRAKAIAAGIERLKPGDVLIIAGKGHEVGQIVGGETFPFDDIDVARKVLGT
jgi:UDP-N-acetylmuramoyl-L-alanyl-D-glutamate--2,6-diaminopimelate ligase